MYVCSQYMYTCDIYIPKKKKTIPARDPLNSVLKDIFRVKSREESSRRGDMIPMGFSGVVFRNGAMQQDLCNISLCNVSVQDL